MQTFVCVLLILLGVCLCSVHTQIFETLVPVIRRHLLNINENNSVGDSKYTSNPEYSLPTPELIKRAGYPVEIHNILTPDGYILTTHRIPHSRSPLENNIKRRPVYVHHGLLCSSAAWVLSTPEKALGFLLSDAGYDVWLGNARGNTYSRNHTHLSPQDHKFWDFSWSEIGELDIPAAIDYILKETNRSKLFYIGHSMGTTIFFTAMATRPQYNKKIAAMIGFGPVATVKHIRSPIRLLVPFSGEIEHIVDYLGTGEFLPGSNLVHSIEKIVCEESHWEVDICENLLFLFFGYDKPQFNTTMLPYILGHEPSGTSTKTVLHYAQEAKSGKFCRFDYGEVGNLLRYGVKDPPEYDLKLVTAPVSLHWGENDWLADPKDVYMLSQKLPNLIGSFRVPYKKFNHVDFLWSIDVKKLLYNDVLKILNKYR